MDIVKNFGGGSQDDSNGIWQYWTTVMKYVKTSDKVESIFPFCTFTLHPMVATSADLL